MANIIQEVQRPTLVIAHNKTLAAQLATEFKEFFPNNAVEYFVSYYDYYQPEAYVPRTDTYVEKDASINEELDKLRLSATTSLLTRRDVLIVASVSCIYGLGDPQDYFNLVAQVRVGEIRERTRLLRQLIEMQYERNDMDLARGKFRVRGDVLETGAGLRGSRHAHPVFRRRGGAHRHPRPADRRGSGAAAGNRHLPRQALRYQQGKAGPGLRRHPSGVGGTAGRTEAPGKRCWKPPAWKAAPTTTWKCCRRRVSAPG